MTDSNTQDAQHRAIAAQVEAAEAATAAIAQRDRWLISVMETIADVTEADFQLEADEDSVAIACTRVRRMAREIEALTVALEAARPGGDASELVADLTELVTARAVTRTLELEGTISDALATLAHRRHD